MFTCLMQFHGVKILCVGYEHAIDWIENKELIKFENIMQNNVRWKHGAVDQVAHAKSTQEYIVFSIPLLTLSQLQHFHYTHFESS